MPTYKLGNVQIKPRLTSIKASQLRTGQFTGLDMDTKLTFQEKYTYIYIFDH